MQIDLSQVESISLDTKSFPKAILEIKYRDRDFVKKVEFSTHDKGYKALYQLNLEWTKTL